MISRSELPDPQFIATTQGIELLHARPVLRGMINAFCRAETLAETQLNGGNFIGTGDNSEVWAISGVAVKVATATTGRSSWYNGKNSPENLMNQFIFLNALGGYLGGNGDVRAPMQYFALRTAEGNYLRVEEYMQAWSPLSQWLRKRGDDVHPPTRDLLPVKARITRSIASQVLRLGLNDLGLEKERKLRTENILIPSSADTFLDVPLCIIDQPTRGIVGLTAVGILRRIASTNNILKLKLSDFN